MAATAPARKRLGLTLAACCVAQAMILLDVTIVNVALPDIQHELNTDPQGLEWILNAYTLALAGLIIVSGSLGDRYGRKRFLLVGLVVFTLASAGCALSASDVQLIGFRALQGVGGAMMAALTLSILMEAYPASRRTSVIGIWSAVAGLGFGLGPVVGGILLSAFSWSSIFWVDVLIGCGALLLAVVGVNESKSATAHRIDWVGAVLVSGALFLLTFGLIESNDHPWLSMNVGGCLVLSALLWVLFVLQESRVAVPLVSLELFRIKTFAAANVVFSLLYVGLSGMFFYVTLFFQNLLGWSALTTGLSWLFMNVLFLAASINAGRITHRFGMAKVIVAGCVLTALSLFILALITPGTPFAVAATGYMLLGLGFGLAVPAASSVAMADVPPGRAGVGSGILNTARQVGNSVGLAVVAAVGVGVTVDHWNVAVAELPASSQGTAAGLGQVVSSGEVSAVGSSIGSGAESLAQAAFLSGYRAALLTAAVLQVVAAAIAAAALRVRSVEDRVTQIQA